MREFLISILGTYTPPTYDSYTVVDGVDMVVHVIPDGLAGVDWLYILTGLLFIVVIYSVFKLLGGLICKIS